MKCKSCGYKKRVREKIHGLRPREWEAAELLAQGLTVKEVAEKMGIAFKTARSHVMCVHKAWNVHKRGKLILKVVKLQKEE